MALLSSAYITPAFALFFAIATLMSPGRSLPGRYRWLIPATLILFAAVSAMRIVVEPSPDVLLRVFSAAASVITGVIAGIQLERVRSGSRVPAAGNS